MSAWSNQTWTIPCRSSIPPGGWKKYGFGDLNQHGPDGPRLPQDTSQRDRRVALRRQEGAGDSSIPTMN